MWFNFGKIKDAPHSIMENNLFKHVDDYAKLTNTTSLAVIALSFFDDYEEEDEEYWED